MWWGSWKAICGLWVREDMVGMEGCYLTRHFLFTECTGRELDCRLGAESEEHFDNFQCEGKFCLFQKLTRLVKVGRIINSRSNLKVWVYSPCSQRQLSREEIRIEMTFYLMDTCICSSCGQSRIHSWNFFKDWHQEVVPLLANCSREGTSIVNKTSVECKDISNAITDFFKKWFVAYSSVRFFFLVPCHEQTFDHFPESIRFSQPFLYFNQAPLTESNWFNEPRSAGNIYYFQPSLIQWGEGIVWLNNDLKFKAIFCLVLIVNENKIRTEDLKGDSVYHKVSKFLT